MCIADGILFLISIAFIVSVTSTASASTIVSVLAIVSISITISTSAVISISAAATVITVLTDRADQAFRTVAYQIHPACHTQTFQYQFPVCRILVLHEGSLDGFLMRILRHINFLPCKRMNPRIVRWKA